MNASHVSYCKLKLLISYIRWTGRGIQTLSYTAALLSLPRAVPFFRLTTVLDRGCSLMCCPGACRKATRQAPPLVKQEARWAGPCEQTFTSLCTAQQHHKMSISTCAASLYSLSYRSEAHTVGRSSPINSLLDALPQELFALVKLLFAVLFRAYR